MKNNKKFKIISNEKEIERDGKGGRERERNSEINPGIKKMNNNSIK